MLEKFRATPRHRSRSVSMAWLAIMGICAGLLPALNAEAATLETGASLSYSQGSWDPFSSCTPNLGSGFAGSIDFIDSGAVGSVSASINSASGPKSDSQSLTGQLRIENNSNAVCTVVNIHVDGVASALLAPTWEFDVFPQMYGLGQASMTQTNSDGSPGAYRSSVISIDSDLFSYPYHAAPFFYLDAFSFTVETTLAPGDSTTFDFSVQAWAMSAVPIPTGALSMMGGLGALTLLARRRRSGHQT